MSETQIQGGRVINKHMSYHPGDTNPLGDKCTRGIIKLIFYYLILNLLQTHFGSIKIRTSIKADNY